MNLEYVDYFKSNNKDEIKRIYIESFPKSERFPFWMLKNCAKEENVVFDVILDNDKVIGMEYLINYDNITYLMYFAIDEKQRNKGYGSKVLKDLIEKYKTIILSIERPRKNLENSKNRKIFYLRNGFNETNKFILDSRVEYEILCTKKDYNITKEILQNRYNRMSNSIIMKYLIRKTFDNNINFIK